MWGNQDPLKIGPDSKPPSYLVAELEHCTSTRTESIIEFFQAFQGIGNTKSLGKKISI